MRWCFPALVLLLLATNLAAQTEDCLHRKLPVLLVNSKTSVPVNIEEGKLRGQLGGKPVKIEALKFRSGIRRVIIVLDASGSMTKQWKTAIELAMFIVKSSPDDLEVGLVTFSDRFGEQITPSTHSNTEILERLDQYLTSNKLPQGKTPLWDGLDRGLSFVASSEADTIFVISDGGENSSKDGLAQIKRKLARTEARLFCVVLWDSQFASDEERLGPMEMAELAKVSGGWMYPAEANLGPLTAAEVTAVEARLRVLLRVRPEQLQIELPDALTDFRLWKLEYATGEGRHDKKLELSYPHLLAPCSAGQIGGK